MAQPTKSPMSAAEAFAATTRSSGVPLKVGVLLEKIEVAADRAIFDAKLSNPDVSHRHVADALTKYVQARGIDESVTEGAVVHYRSRHGLLGKK